MASILAEHALDWQAIWDEFGGDYVQRLEDETCPGSRDVDRELLFCLLGGHSVPFELAHSATRVLAGLNIFSSAWDPEALEAALERELQRPQFEPRRLDGTLRRYRYPRRKAVLIVGAAEWVRRTSPLYQQLHAIDDERRRREWLCNCPGIGPKTASWFLRNIGLAHELAVIDIHVLRALTEADLVSGVRLPRDYDFVERTFLNWCHELGAPPAAFDLLLWEWQRAL